MSRKNREKRRLRQRQPKHALPSPSSQNAAASAMAFFRDFETHLKTPEPTIWPGACDASLERPDLVKAEFAAFALDKKPGTSKFRQLRHGVEAGLLAKFPDLDHWAMEEFLWHGLPGDDWSPLEAFLAQAGNRFSAQAAAQLRLWQEARIGFFEVGPVEDNLVILREWDPAAMMTPGPEFKAISLNIGGVNIYRTHLDEIQLTYLAPWALEQNLYCAMGYGTTLPPEVTPMLLPLLGLRTPEAAARAVPWKATPTSFSEHAKIWRQRAWQDWLAAGLKFPFEAVICMPNDDLEIFQAEGLVPGTPEEVETTGIYLIGTVDRDDSEVVMGATNPVPWDFTSPNAWLLAEYRAYRELVGPPKGVGNVQAFIIDPENDD